jgi:2-polyprenyl-6-methoxyphenol hydroxylase-like FAD-dependent oxidoreductase
MHALIVGGGISGPVAAMALQRMGIEARVFEAYPRGNGEVGSYFTVTPNGLDALAAIGALHRALESGFPTRRNVMRNSAGRVLGELPLGEPLADGTPALTMKRSKLAVRLLDEAESRGISVEHSRRLVDASSFDGKIQASFADGSTETADILIGADGVHSVVRRFIDPSAPRGRYVGLTNFGGITEAVVAPVQLESEAWQFWFGRHAFFGAHPTPGGDVVWFVNAPRPEITQEERASTSAEAWQESLARLFEDDRSPAAALIRAGRLELAADNTYDLGHVPVWHRNQMIVIGDAAHAPAPSSGQGASMALEDAVLLARFLGEAGSIDEAFAGFEASRRDRVERIVAQGARSSSSKTPGRVGGAVRDVVLRLVFRYAITDESLSWMYDYRVGHGGNIKTSSPPHGAERSGTSPKA